MSTPCPRCGYVNPPGEAVCSLCGTLFTGAADDPFRLASPKAPPPPGARHVLHVPVGWIHLIAGLVLALVFTLTPALRFMGWLLGSLFHETGHVVFAWYVGCPAWPAISLQGHAAAFHQPQSGTILVFVGLILALAVWQAWHYHRFRALATSALVAWPLFAFFGTPRELGFLLSGHLGELVFAAIFLWRARTGQAVEREAERPIYACLGWFLVARNVILCFGIAFLPSARAGYMTSGSFGLTNDYARVAGDVLHIPLAAVAVFMLVVSLSVVPLVLAATWTPRGIPLPPRVPGSGPDHSVHPVSASRIPAAPSRPPRILRRLPPKSFDSDAPREDS